MSTARDSPCQPGQRAGESSKTVPDDQSFKNVPDDYSCTLRASARLTRLMERVCSNATTR